MQLTKEEIVLDYHLIENDFAMTVTTKQTLGFKDALHNRIKV